MGDSKKASTPRKYRSPIVFLRAVMNDPNATISERLRAARALAQLEQPKSPAVAKAVAKGKKQQLSERATEIAAAGGRFATRRPPANVAPEPTPPPDDQARPALRVVRGD